MQITLQRGLILLPKLLIPHRLDPQKYPLAQRRGQNRKDPSSRVIRLLGSHRCGQRIILWHPAQKVGEGAAAKRSKSSEVPKASEAEGCASEAKAAPPAVAKPPNNPPISPPTRSPSRPPPIKGSKQGVAP